MRFSIAWNASCRRMRVDAKERLRRYLEQRRELGESELVLDGMPVDDLMSLIGARGPTPRAESTRRNATADQPTTTSSTDDPTDVTSERRDEPEGASSAHAGDAAPAASPPPEPERRFDASASTDWRETLRRAGAAKDGPMKDAPAKDAPVAASRADLAGHPAAEQPALLPADAMSAEPPVPSWLTELGLPLGLSAGQAASRALEPAIAQLPTLDAIAEMVRTCTRCDLYRTAIKPVPGSGDPDADFVCVGEAPGQNEDEQGVPFVGAAGDLLNKILGAIKLTREQVFVCNVLKHRPPQNRDPLPDEVRACEPYLRRQLELVKPRVILALGRFAAQSLLQTNTPIGKLRGQIHRYHGIPLIVTYHPAALLRNEAWKRPTWDDVRLARRILDASRAASGLTSGNSPAE